ncbi:glycoside hydrolase family 16 protein [Flagelloscypha sp. PMI_526]|nr:glycoside hydrolase family 16 protein [Flagelloscypha sp. PMI_526]
MTSCLFAQSLVFFLALVNSWTLALPQSYATRANSPACTPFRTTFSSLASSQFRPISDHETFKVDRSGLSMFLDRPAGTIGTTHDGKVNDKLADGATMNSTFYMHYGKLMIEMTAPSIPGVVTAAILIADQKDEIDIECLGGTPSRWDSNIFAPTPNELKPLYGVFNMKQRFPKDKEATTSEMHKYTIDWNKDRIIWSVDGDIVRTLNRRDTIVAGSEHFPTHPARVQLGIWDASGPVGTAHWAKGPINWNGIEGRIRAVVKSIEVECHD